jgi:hypothetical protein
VERIVMTNTHRNVRGRPSIGPPAGLYDQIRANVAATSASTTRTRTRIVAALIAVAVVAVLVVVSASEMVYKRVGVGLDVNPLQSAQLLWTLVLLAALTAFATVVAIWRGRHGFGMGAASLALLATFVAPLYAVLTLVQPLHRHDAAIAGVTISPWGVRCALIAGIVGTAVVVGLTMALRRAVPVASRLRGAVIGATAGAWAGLAVFVFCPSGDHQHLIVGHLLPVVVLTLLGALVAPRLLRP